MSYLPRSFLKNKTMFTARIFLLAAAVVFGAVPSQAFVREFDDGSPGAPAIEWTKNRTVLMHLSIAGGGGFSDGGTSFNAVAEAALNIWNQHLVHMKFAVNSNSILPPSGIDGNTSVTMSNTIYGDSFGANVLAVTLVTPRNGQMIEADVIFNLGRTWDSYRGSRPGADEIDFRRVALHEFGHVVGLDHPDQASPKQTVAAIMNSIISNSIDNLQADDINGAHTIYDSGPSFLTSNPAPYLVNLSTRAFVGTGNNVVIGGFIIQGSQPATVVLRGIGNSLPAVGINNPLHDPVIELHSASGATLATSDDWIDDSWATTIASYHLDPTNSQESAILATLSPGSYTVVVRSFDNGDGQLTGTALVELYDLHTTGGRAGNISTRGPVLTRIVTDYGKRPMRWIDAVKQQYKHELTSEQKRRFLARMGSRVRVRDLQSGREVVYVLVGPGEVNATEGKISIASPSASVTMARFSSPRLPFVSPRRFTLPRRLSVLTDVTRTSQMDWTASLISVLFARRSTRNV